MEKTMTRKEYVRYVEKKAPKPKAARNTFRAFIVGGAICSFGQLITNLLRARGLSQDIASSLTVLIMVFLGILFTGLNVYDELGRFAGAGSIVPITGFANSMVSPALEYKSEGYILGVGAKMFIIAGPVLVYGVSASVVAGIIYYLIKF